MSESLLPILERIEKAVAENAQVAQKTTTSLAVIEERLGTHIEQTQMHFDSDEEYQKEVDKKLGRLDKDHSNFRTRVVAVASVIGFMAALASDFIHAAVARLF